MRLLWVSNSPIGPASEILGKEYKGSSGGWIQSEYELLDKSNKQFFFLCTLPSVKKREILHRTNDIGEIYCVNAPRISYGISVPRELQKNIQMIVDQIKPDIIQIWGTETWLSNAVSKCETNASKIIFVQGLIGIHKRYLGGYFGTTHEDKIYLRGTSITCKIKEWARKRFFAKQAKIEKETISNCKNVIVDSDFAKAYCSSINENIICYQHVLFPNCLFYQKEWRLENCNRYTVFTVYGSSAEKGIQNLLKAVAIVRRKFPNIKVVVPGGYQLDVNGRLTTSKKDSFQNVMYNIISDLNLQNNVIFTGRLNSEQMANIMEKCHIFVNPSCMEVHALSLREAMVVGVPCISSQCGSVAEYLQNKFSGFIYRYEEYETLAYYIEKIFENDEEAKLFSQNARKSLNCLKEDSLKLDDIYINLLAK